MVMFNMEDSVKRAFMETMDEEFVKEFGFNLKTVMLFADAVYKVKTFKEKELETELELVKKERDKYKERFDELKDRIQCGWFTDLEYYFEIWEKEDAGN